MSDYYGFIYIWRDRKTKMFYIGSHAGDTGDGYIASSIWLKRAYKKRKEDFKRRILSFIYTNKNDLLQEEGRWLSFIMESELGKKYYNLKKCAAGGITTSAFTEQQKINYRNKLVNSANKGKDHYKFRPIVCMGVVYDTFTEAKQAIGFHPQYRVKSRRYKDFYFLDEGPLTAEEIEREEVYQRERSIKRSQNANMVLSRRTSAQRKEIARKCIETRTKNGLDFYKKVSHALKMRPGRKVSINGEIYDKGRVAAELLGVNYGTLKSRLKNPNFKDWYYCDSIS